MKWNGLSRIPDIIAAPFVRSARRRVLVTLHRKIARPLSGSAGSRPRTSPTPIGNRGRKDAVRVCRCVSSGKSVHRQGRVCWEFDEFGAYQTADTEQKSALYPNAPSDERSAFGCWPTNPADASSAWLEVRRPWCPKPTPSKCKRPSTLEFWS